MPSVQQSEKKGGRPKPGAIAFPETLSVGSRVRLLAMHKGVETLKLLAREIGVPLHSLNSAISKPEEKHMRRSVWDRLETYFGQPVLRDGEGEQSAPEGANPEQNSATHG